MRKGTKPTSLRGHGLHPILKNIAMVIAIPYYSDLQHRPDIGYYFAYSDREALPYRRSFYEALMHGLEWGS